MGIETLTDERITQLLAEPKRVENPLAREKTEGKHLRQGYAVETQAYHSLAGALHHLVKRANIQGLKTEPDGAQQAGLFGDKS